MSKEIVIAGKGAVGLRAARDIATARPDIKVTVVGPAQNIKSQPSSLVITQGTYKGFLGHMPNGGAIKEVHSDRNRLRERIAARAIRVRGVVAPLYTDLTLELERQVRSLPNTEVLDGKVIGLAGENGRISKVQISNGNESQIEIAADLVIGASGKSEVIAKLLPNVIETREFNQPGTTLAAYLDLPPNFQEPGIDLNALTFKKLPSGVSLMFMPALDHGYLAIISGRKSIIDGVTRQSSLVKDIHELRRLGIEKLTEGTEWHSVLLQATAFNSAFRSTEKVHTRKVKSGNVVLIGDEASDINQRLGLGLMRGGRDVQVLVSSLQKYEDVVQAGARYNRRRNRTAFLEAELLHIALVGRSALRRVRRKT